MRAPSPTVTGRLRLRFTQLKQQREQLAVMAAAMHAIDGVTSVETSQGTGGLLIHYDAAIGRTTRFWDQVEAVLLAHQLLLDPRPLGIQDAVLARTPPTLAFEARSPGGPVRPGAAIFTPAPPHRTSAAHARCSRRQHRLGQTCPPMHEWYWQGAG